MNHKSYFYLGLVIVLLMVVPYLVLGTDAVVKIHDQLDGEFIAYIFNARYLFSGKDILPPFLGGVPKTALIPPAPLSVLLFLGNNYFAALIIMQMIGSVTGYVGMYLLSGSITDNRMVAAATGVLFAYLSFNPVYGLSHFGIPLLFWCFLKIKDGQYMKGSFLYTILYALNSSLALVGFIILAFIFIGIVYTWKKGGNIKAMLAAWFGMMLAYFLTNLSLISQILGFSLQPISHKSDYILRAEPFFPTLFLSFINGRDHSISYHGFLLIVVVIILIIHYSRENLHQHKLYRLMLLLISINFALALITALYNGPPGVFVRTRMEIFGTIQLTRVMWVAPTIWYLLFAVTAAFVLSSKMTPTKIVSSFLILIATIFTSFNILMANNIKPNFQKILNPAYAQLSFSDYYALGVLDQVEEYIREQTNLSQKDYRVLSLGINPAAALYHGFYSLDGYSNNYPLEYKFAFRSIIAPELAKNEINQINFDYWGNRCYIFSAENDGIWPIRKDTFVYRDLAINTDIFKEMGGKFLISAAYIENASDINLRLVRNEPFETPNSYSRIYLYEVN